MRRNLLGLVLLCCVGLVGGLGPAWAHGDLHSTSPAAGESVKKVPGHVILDFTERPTKDAKLSVLDGCRNEVAREIFISKTAAHVLVAKDAQPGRFKVSYSIISNEDGHATKGRYAFTVEGNRDCSPDEPEPTDEATDGAAAPPPVTTDDGGSSLPVVPIAAGTVGILGLALMVRRLTAH